MASQQQTSEHSEPSDSNDNTTHPVERFDEEARVQESLDREAPTTVRGALSKTAFVIYVCTIVAYIFLSAQGPGQDQNRFMVARLV
jgi:hypothetical protein